MPLFSVETYGELEPHLHQEWLVTNGLGGYAASTVVGCNTRRYHAILCAATLPPVGRIIALNRFQEILYVDGDVKRPLEFSVNQFRNCFHPRGDRFLRRFQLDDALARWEYEIEDVRVVKELQMIWRRNIAAVRYTVDSHQADRKLQLRLLPLIGLRDFHAERHGSDAAFAVDVGVRNVSVREGNRYAPHRQRFGQLHRGARLVVRPVLRD